MCIFVIKDEGLKCRWKDSISNMFELTQRYTRILFRREGKGGTAPYFWFFFSSIRNVMAYVQQRYVVRTQFSTPSFQLRACSHEPRTVNSPGVMIAPGQALLRVHLMIRCQHCSGTTSLPKGKFNVISHHYEII